MRRLSLFLLLAAGCAKEQPPADKPKADEPAGEAHANPAPAAAAGPYADLGEDTVDAAKAGVGAPLRPRAKDAVFKISNPRFQHTGPGPFQALVFDYEKANAGDVQELTMVFRTPDGETATARLSGSMKEKFGQVAIRQGFGPWNQIPKTAEVYVTNTDGRYEGRPTFKVSNTVALGEMQGRTLARSWTPTELASLTKPPPPPKQYLTPRLQPPTEGEDTELVGSEGGVRMWFLDPPKSLLGFDYWMGAWEDEPSPSGMVPVFARDQPVQPGHTRLIVKDGYAVTGMTVSTKRFANAFRLTFGKLAPDDTVDAADTYESAWVGTRLPGATETKLGNDGRRAIGFYANKGAIHNAIGLVLADPAGREKSPRDAKRKPVGPKPVGVDTEMVGAVPTKEKPFGQDARHVDPKERPLLGIDFRMGEWAGEPSPAQLSPVYDRESRPFGFVTRVVAKDGYAVGGVTVAYTKNVNSLRLTFMKLNPDGMLDPKAKYDSDWFAPRPAGAKETKLGGDGRAVLGFVVNYQAITHCFGLVLK